MTGEELSKTPQELVAALPANVVKGPTGSKVEYLARHFRLLRYDAFSALHESVTRRYG